jgi:hypothetical protein
MIALIPIIRPRPDVTIRTTDHNGAGDESDAMLDAGKRSGEFHIQRVARVLPSRILGAAERPRIYNNPGLWVICLQPADLCHWRSGAADFSFGMACARLAVEPTPDRFNSELRRSRQSLFDSKGRRRGLAGGHTRQCSGELCDYAHLRPGFADADLWCSNGPIYVAEVFRN